jgi:carboxylesterase type B
MAPCYIHAFLCGNKHAQDIVEQPLLRIDGPQRILLNVTCPTDMASLFSSLTILSCWSQHSKIQSYVLSTTHSKANMTSDITHFRRMSFAAPPTGKNRFQTPQPPLPIINGIYNSDHDFSMCLQRTVNGFEDCLYLRLYSQLWTETEDKKPVVVFFYVGAFIQGSASFSISSPGYPTLNVSSEIDFILVYPNYRVNAFGFLPDRRVKTLPRRI